MEGIISPDLLEGCYKRTTLCCWQAIVPSLFVFDKIVQFCVVCCWKAVFITHSVLILIMLFFLVKLASVFQNVLKSVKCESFLSFKVVYKKFIYLHIYIIWINYTYSTYSQSKVLNMEDQYLLKTHITKRCFPPINKLIWGH